MGEIEAEYFFRGNNPKNRMMYVKRQFQKCKKPHRETKILLDILHELLPTLFSSVTFFTINIV